MKREKYLQMLIEIAKPVYYFVFKAHKTSWKTSLQDLKNYPEHSLGKELFEFLKENNIEMMGKFENHDICHVLTGYSTDCVSESCMQFFLFGTGKKSLFVFGTLVISILVLPEHIPLYIQAFKRGGRTPYFDHLDFEKLLDLPLHLLQAQLMERQEMLTLSIKP